MATRRTLRVAVMRVRCVSRVARWRLPRRIAPLLVAVAALAVRPVAAATSLYLRGDASDFVSGGREVLVTDAQASFRAIDTYGGGVSLTVSDPSPGGAGFFTLDFRPPAGQPLVAGAYEGAWDGGDALHPGLEIFGNGRACDSTTGRFVVHEIALAPDSAIAAFTADFEQHCGASPAGLVGTVRFHAGDASCATAADGAACSVPPGCTPGGGSCAACTTAAACAAARCEGGLSLDCDDRDPCTTDACAAPGSCRHAPLPGCWNVAGRAVLSAHAAGSYLGHDYSCALRCQLPVAGTLQIRGDGTFRAPSGAGPSVGGPVVGCSSGDAPPVPDEVGEVRQRRGRLVLVPKNLHDIGAALSRCAGRRIAIRRDRTILRTAADASAFDAVESVAGRVGGFPALDFAATARVHGVPGGAPLPDPAAQPFGSRARSCLEAKVRCTVR